MSKALLIRYKVIHGKAPVYIQELLEMKSSSQIYYRLRTSQDQTMLKYPLGTSKIILGDRAFMYAAPKLWNNLPLFVRKSATGNEFHTRKKKNICLLMLCNKNYPCSVCYIVRRSRVSYRFSRSVS